MPKRTDIHTILIIGSGPIVIGQAAEFDYSGTQACKVLRAEGYRVVLVNSNPATIMTDPEMADATYIEPLTPEVLTEIIKQEKPDALLPTVGGQTGLNLSMKLAESGVLERYGVELIGARLPAIQAAEDRKLFQETMNRAGLPTPRSDVVTTVAQAQKLAAEIGYPLLIRPSFMLGGSGGGIAYDAAQLPVAVERGLRESPIHSVLVEESVLGWKEFELEVMRDRADNFVVVCSIENFDPMGVHTGDSITVAPAQTLTDKEYQRLRNMARTVMTAVGVETGGSNVQFAVNPVDGRVVVIEMNPRVSRSSALASKATGFPIAKIAALLAVGYTLDEITNDITRQTKAAFEPSLDYVVVKIPRWAFEKFPQADPVLGPQMKSVGEVLALGRTFKEALLKAMRSLELRDWRTAGLDSYSVKAASALTTPTSDRLLKIFSALRNGVSIADAAHATGVDPWFLTQIRQIIDFERTLAAAAPNPTLLHEAKRLGMSDQHIAALTDATEDSVRSTRRTIGLAPTYLRVDTCAAEFEAFTPYLYSSYESEDEARTSDRRKVIIIGSGPNRIGQGIEFDYCCVQASYELRATGYETIMLNCNPETVSTDYDTSDRLYFEPLVLEHVLDIYDREKPLGVIVQLGGQTPLNLTVPLARAGVNILGTSADAIDLAEDRERFSALLRQLDIPQPEHGYASDLAEARVVAERIGYPLLVRPSYVLGGRAMAIVYNNDQLESLTARAFEAGDNRPVLIDRYLEDSFEVDVDAVCDGERVVIGGILEHIEEAGVHSGDSAAVLPPYKISEYHLGIVRDYTHMIGKALGVRGLMNVQFAMKDDIIYVLEVNPRASRTVPFISKATGVPLTRIAAQVMLGKSLAELGFTVEPKVDGFFVKEAVLPFRKFLGVDAVLGPEMRSTGEVMGHASHVGHAFAKAEMAAGDPLPLSGTALLSVNDNDKGAIVKIARDLQRLGFKLVATHGTAQVLKATGVPCERVNKVSEGSPHTADVIRGGQVQLIINTPLGSSAISDGGNIRLAAVSTGVPLLTTLSAALAAVQGIRAMQEKALQFRSLQAHYAHANAREAR
ncbi:MAG: carbamoyl-phosphate synthase large subunit [Chloroflexi bacterium]|nr:carbamoyl-phosphate synthase large subunit [Chloroflexota bacterium]